MSRRVQQVVVLLHNQVVYWAGKIGSFLQIDHLVGQLLPIGHQGGSTKTTGGPYKTKAVVLIKQNCGPT